MATANGIEAELQDYTVQLAMVSVCLHSYNKISGKLPVRFKCLDESDMLWSDCFQIEHIMETQCDFLYRGSLRFKSNKIGRSVGCQYHFCTDECTE